MSKLARLLSSTILGAFLISGPLAAQDVTTDYDHAFQFNKVKSYTYAKVQATDPLVEPRLTIAIDRVLQGLGWSQTSKNPNVTIAVIVANTPDDYATFYNGLNGYSWQRGWGSGGFSDTASSLQQIPTGTLVVDMYTPAGGKLVWRAMASQPAEDKERKKEDAIDKSVNAIFKKFPPKSGGPMVPNQTSPADSPSSKPITGPS